ncbi:expressed unknown protein [Seminavis robusta]|uniref:C2H2-type domain-containing protein n=1 Tax=Seminavis robusta TaxID=568900 RepID=A0A9N8H7T8_9STRA|nr:expressed unknown protein [Seminavis robusta]|eukprot:Sro215_g088941.1  (194) ;mRNA; f:22621-23202
MDGLCVWNSLLLGTAGLDAAVKAQVSSHMSLLTFLKSAARNFEETRDGVGGVPLFRQNPVKWNMRSLTRKEYTEARQAVLVHPLLITLTAAFQLEIIHKLENAVVVYEVQHPRRAVHLVSNESHMEHERNVDYHGYLHVAKCAGGRKLITAMDWDDGASLIPSADFTCGTCGRRFPNKKNLDRHETHKHRETK